MTAAALGASLAMDTFDGPRDLEVRRGTQSGDSITLRGLGVTHLRGTGRGDVIVHAMVQTPTKLDAAQEELLRQLAAARGEERPEGRVANPAEGSIFGKLRDAFKARVTPSAAPPRPGGPGGSRGRRRRRARRAGGPARRHRAAHPGGGAPAAHRRRGPAGRGRGRRGRGGHARPARGLGGRRPRADAPGSCWCRRWRRTTATTRRSRRPPSAGSTRWCRGRRRAAWCSGAANAARRPGASGMPCSWPPRSSPVARGDRCSRPRPPPPRSRRGCATRHPPSCSTRTPPCRSRRRPCPTPVTYCSSSAPRAACRPRSSRRSPQAGAVAVRLGSTVLRSSSAGPAALAVLSATSRWR